jgi:hypothetical protein
MRCPGEMPWKKVSGKAKKKLEMFLSIWHKIERR